MRVQSSVLGLWLTILAQGCGGAGAPGAKGPARAADDVEQLAEEVLAAEQALLAERQGAAPPAQAPGTTPAEGGEEAKHAEPAPAPAESPSAEPTATSKPTSPCETACKALASMKRSQERICEITGPAHEKCEWAKRKVADATARVESAGCRC